jgi:hypothetical protein
MKKQKNVKGILYNNGITDYTYIDILGGVPEYIVAWTSGNTAKIGSADGNQADDLTLVTGSTTTVSTSASGETYFKLQGIESATVNGFLIEKTVNGVFISGNTIVEGETFDAENNDYYTYLGDSNGLFFRILTLGGSGETSILLQSITLSGETTANLTTNIQLSGTGTYSDASTTNVIDDLSFSSSNSSVATVSLTGLVEPVSAGSVVITGTYNDPITSTQLTDTYSITIIGIETLELSGSTTAASGDTIQLSGTGTYSDASEVVLTTDSNMTYVSSDEAVATVDSDGLVTTLTDGTVIITATYDGPLAENSISDDITIIVS